MSATTLTQATLAGVRIKGGKEPHATVTFAVPLGQNFERHAAFLAICAETGIIIELAITAVAQPVGPTPEP